MNRLNISMWCPLLDILFGLLFWIIALTTCVVFFVVVVQHFIVMLKQFQCVLYGGEAVSMV